jgi:hypothetical protein
MRHCFSPFRLCFERADANQQSARFRLDKMQLAFFHPAVNRARRRSEKKRGVVGREHSPAALGAKWKKRRTALSDRQKIFGFDFDFRLFFDFQNFSPARNLLEKRRAEIYNW